MLFSFSSSGTLHYEENPYKLIVRVDPELSRYYRSLCPKWMKVSPQKYPAHISVVRKEVPSNLEHWKKYQGNTIKFLYLPYVYGGENGEVYFWLNVFCKELEKIRTELGLSVSSEWTRPPNGFDKCFHLTIGNCKGIK